MRVDLKFLENCELLNKHKGLFSDGMSEIAGHGSQTLKKQHEFGSQTILSLKSVSAI